MEKVGPQAAWVAPAVDGTAACTVGSDSDCTTIWVPSFQANHLPSAVMAGAVSVALGVLVRLAGGAAATVDETVGAEASRCSVDSTVPARRRLTSVVPVSQWNAI